MAGMRSGFGTQFETRRVIDKSVMAVVAVEEE